MRLHVRRASLGLSTALLATAGLLAGCGSDNGATGATGATGDADGKTAEAAPAPEAEAAADWLAGQLDGGVMSTSYENPPGSGKWATATDYGLTLDVYFALLASEDHEAERTAVLDAVEPQADGYVGAGKDAYAGSLGKLVTALQAADRDPAEYADGNLLTRLEGLVTTDAGDQLGRASDTWDPGNEFGADYSNTIGQSWVVRALAGADSDLADEAVTFLLKQQCADGYFRVPMESADHSCDAGTAEQSAPSADATAFAVLALLDAQQAEVGDVQPEVETALADAVDWLSTAQAEDGSFRDADTDQPNANSTGVAAEALIALDETDAAREAARWLAEHQVTADAPGRLARQAGAVAFDDAALQAAEAKGITRAVRYQWQRATAQSVAALAVLDPMGS